MIYYKRAVSVEVVADNHEDMVKEGLKLVKTASNIAVKLPLTNEGLISCKNCGQNINTC